MEYTPKYSVSYFLMASLNRINRRRVREVVRRECADSEVSEMTAREFGLHFESLINARVRHGWYLNFDEVDMRSEVVKLAVEIREEERKGELRVCYHRGDWMYGRPCVYCGKREDRMKFPGEVCEGER